VYSKINVMSLFIFYFVKTMFTSNEDNVVIKLLRKNKRGYPG